MPSLPFWVYILIAHKEDAILEKNETRGIQFYRANKIVQNEYEYLKLSYSQLEL